MKLIPFTLAIALSCATSGLHSQADQTSPAVINPAFFTVLRSGQASKLQQALDQGADANARDPQGNTALMLAAAYGELDSMKLLLQHGAEVNAKNAAGATALMRAAISPEKIAILLQHGADVQAQSALGNTALMLAARPAVSERAVELLLNHGADAKATNHWGATALMAAAAGGDARSVKLLLEHGADVHAQPVADHAGFIFGGGRTALMWAAFRGDLAIMNLLLEAGAGVNTPSLLGSPLSQAVWGEHIDAARLLIERGANANLPGPMDGYSAMHWAASSEGNDATLVNLLLSHGGDPNRGGGEHVDAFMGTVQTPWMLASRRGDSAVLVALVKAGGTNGTPDRASGPVPSAKTLPEHLSNELLRSASGRAVPLLQKTSLESKQAFLRHDTHQDCTSCHQQYLPMAAIGLARKDRVEVDRSAEEELIQMVKPGELKNPEVDWEALFHPDPVQTKGYALFGLAAEDVPVTETIDSWVHHLCAIQGKDGQWHNNLPRPPIQTSDVSATALAVHALQRYPLPGRQAELTARVQRARQWLWTVSARNQEERAYQILGLAWAGEPTSKLEPLAHALMALQQPDGGWSQLPTTKSDAFATGQAIYALRVGAGLGRSEPAVEGGLRFLLQTQLDDGSWFVRRRAFPFQPTMNSGFPHGRDSWISAAATSWAVMALSLPQGSEAMALKH